MSVCRGKAKAALTRPSSAKNPTGIAASPYAQPTTDQLVDHGACPKIQIDLHTASGCRTCRPWATALSRSSAEPAVSGEQAKP
jgi:hypothetical protein